MDSESPSMLKPTLIGGGVAGLIGGLPLIGALNCLCCSLVVAGGFLASYLYSKECRVQGTEFRAGSGALVGLVAGMFYALVTVIISGVVNALTGASVAQAIEQIESMGQQIPPEAEPVIEFMTNSSPILLMVMGFFLWLLIAAVFSTIGGLIGGAVFKVEPPPAGAMPSSGMTPPDSPMGGGSGGPPTT